MAVVLARVDNRLVHGQVLEAWVPFLGADAILVVGREVAEDPLRRMILEGLRRPDLEIWVTAAEGAPALLGGRLGRRRVLVLFEGIRQALEAWDAGVRFDRLNLGNVHPGPGSRSLTPSVNLTEVDVAGLAELSRRGVALEARAVPADRSPDLAAQVLRGA